MREAKRPARENYERLSDCSSEESLASALAQSSEVTVRVTGVSEMDWPGGVCRNGSVHSGRADMDWIEWGFLPLSLAYHGRGVPTSPLEHAVSSGLLPLTPGGWPLVSTSSLLIDPEPAAYLRRSDGPLWGWKWSNWFFSIPRHNGPLRPQLFVRRRSSIDYNAQAPVVTDYFFSHRLPDGTRPAKRSGWRPWRPRQGLSGSDP
ncbi:uncharacterized protein F5Z01DRAFT_368761 [Emericellopsis atlantica]|uniref:Uncharacterized protein n=1 Tax=Emericellopsis atlantica TaxID=2614577 RepID=A0A9P8CKX6_9HYPO|nr:uncharacterized protein F5Z01DRAFT_368761 [Emericellopsis atlantica]KAG9250497.1 hypothetical protein F5Z01DRAFT_368761 [Emericellopsis atlantica]